MNKRRYDSEVTKKDIMEHASLLFSQKGYNQTSVGDIAKASGYSKGHIYYHFKNKEQLFVLLAQETMQNWYEKWAAKESTYSTATEKLYGMAIHVLYNYQTPLLKSGQEFSSNPKSSSESVKKLFDLAIVPMSTYRAILQEGIEKNEFEDGNLDEWTILLGTWLGGLCQLTNTEELKALEPLFSQAITIFLKSIKKGGNENEDWVNR
ncbi:MULTISPECIES: TetR family transcriptional regulator C-terminal domain-containing protein [Bacillus cereus group]|uniref:Transcriptional regulator, TetR family n=1 Tax=Bacillus cytotoxicus (strain DSM 22905 / CIP 110041 / 391-98 / NVH 391-98) TaxID=315749 RepID=A7GPR9_BACCN|nr:MULTISPECIES: TetR/AcrR family transcriptional regulator [Bacillus cereus group]ABS22127.1 transcriptional regulator, TetR family [Bacillus cytotoxicus NVH 391-98]AWC28733.1 TetR family transcriptional regulator [Bacillus cytotoxicus]AWC39884.1 TetR family transcriptional regulator [Bacillus cytotoxicus]AWC44807.1 TetR family transcriptional regulator [Bacillus cytotoxicus]AWC47815.1 TetR family transcriptional regulator [Bacillus cytotoxicus]